MVLFLARLAVSIPKKQIAKPDINFIISVNDEDQRLPLLCWLELSDLDELEFFDAFPDERFTLEFPLDRLMAELPDKLLAFELPEDL